MQTQLIFPILILITVSLNTLAQVLLKLASGQNILNLYLVGGLISYGLSTIVYITVLGKFHLSIAYPVVIGLTVVATSIAGVFLLREKFAFVNWMGIGLIITGIFAVALGKTT